MFTQGTKQFGVWRTGHPSLNRYTGKPTHAILLAYGFCAFLTWLIFILTLKVRGEFFLIESMNLKLHTLNSEISDPSPLRSAGLSVALRAGPEAGKARIVFDTGESFLFPDEQSQLAKFIEWRTESMELSAMIRKSASPGMSTAVLWVENSIPLSSVQPFVKMLVAAGFDSVNYVVEGKSKQKLGGQ